MASPSQVCPELAKATFPAHLCPMVADSAQKTVSRPYSPKDSRHAALIPLHSRLMVRNLYLGQGLPHKQIALRTGLEIRQVRNIVSRDKLTALRREKEKKFVATSDARTDATFEAFNAQLAAEAEEISLGALKNARIHATENEKDSARNFQSITGGILNLVKASRTVRGLDQRNAASGGGDSTAVIFVKLERVGETAPKEIQAAQIAEKRADAIDVSANPVAALENPPARESGLMHPVRLVRGET